MTNKQKKTCLVLKLHSRSVLVFLLFQGLAFKLIVHNVLKSFFTDNEK